MFTLKRSNSENPDFQQLIIQLDKVLAVLDGEDHAFYAQYNKVDTIKNVVVAYDDNTVVGCGAFKEFNPETVEIKRMFVPGEFRGQGIATLILKELEKWAAELNYQSTILETGILQVEAVRLYEKNGYHRIPNYGQYEEVENSLCFGKENLRLQ